MAEPNNAVATTATAPKIRDGVLSLADVEPTTLPGSTVYPHYNGPTDQLDVLCAGMAILEPGASPHPPHRHPEEEILIIAAGTGVIECNGEMTDVGPGAIMYCASETLHGITNTGQTPMTFYWSKWYAEPSKR